jgi:hypothetical protein
MAGQIRLCQSEAFAQIGYRQLPAEQAAQDHQTVPARKRTEERFRFAGLFPPEAPETF